MPSTDAIAILKQDHKKVRALLSELESTTDRAAKKREKLLMQIEKEVTIHTQVEDEIFYPAYKEAVEKKDDVQMFYEAKEEHHVVKLVMPEIKETDPSSVEFGAKAKVLKELIEHHAKEEEKEMFPKAKEVMDKDELQALGERILQRKQQLMRGR